MRKRRENGEKRFLQGPLVGPLQKSYKVHRFCYEIHRILASFVPRFRFAVVDTRWLSVFKMMNFVFKMMHSAFTMMNFVFKMMNFARDYKARFQQRMGEYFEPVYFVTKNELIFC